jgi:hypothetical protein
MQHFQLHTAYPNLTNNSKVIIEDYTGNKEYAVVQYDQDTASFVLAFFEDDSFILPKINKEFEQITEQIQDIGFEVLKIIE